MSRLSLYDQHKQKAQEAQYHKNNIADLEAQLKEAHDLLRCMPFDESDIRLMAERTEVAKHIEVLEEWLADERACIKEDNQPTPEQMDNVARHLGL